MSETEVIEITGFQSKDAIKQLPMTLRNHIRHGAGRILVACSVGMVRSKILLAALPDGVAANGNNLLGYNALSVLDPESPQVVLTQNEEELRLAYNGGVRPFNRILLATGNPGEKRLADLIVIKPLIERFQGRLSQVITVDLPG